MTGISQEKEVVVKKETYNSSTPMEVLLDGTQKYTSRITSTDEKTVVYGERSNSEEEAEESAILAARVAGIK